MIGIVVVEFSYFVDWHLWLQNDCAVEVDYAGGNGGGT